MLATLNASAAVKIAAALGASVAIGATAVAGPDILPFVGEKVDAVDPSGTVETGVDADLDVNGDLFGTQLEGTTDGSEGADADADLGVTVDAG